LEISKEARKLEILHPRFIEPSSRYIIGGVFPEEKAFIILVFEAALFL